MMAPTLIHFMVSIIIALTFGVLIDYDHGGTNTDKFKCMFKTNPKEVANMGLSRGILHNKTVWILTTIAYISYTFHLIFDDLIL